MLNRGLGNTKVSSILTLSAKVLWQTWCMRWTENPKNKVRLLEAPLINKIGS